MSLLDHLEELRARLLRSILSLAVAFLPETESIREGDWQVSAPPVETIALRNCKVISRLPLPSAR